MFFRLVAGGLVIISFVENDFKENFLLWVFDSDWEEVFVEQSSVIFKFEVNLSNQYIFEDIIFDEEVVREDIICENVSNFMENDIVIKFLKGYLEEEVDL